MAISLLAASAAAQTASARSEADVRFLRHMIVHHAQALVMTALVPDRTERIDMRLLAERIEVSQRDEIELMQRLLADRGAHDHVGHVSHDRPAGSRHDHAGEHGTMPGMLSGEQLERLAAAGGAEFERLFLENMIQHHEGALVMVVELFATPGAGEDPAIYRFAADVEADQQAEITRMRGMLAAFNDSLVTR